MQIRHLLLDVDVSIVFIAFILLLDLGRFRVLFLYFIEYLLNLVQIEGAPCL